MGIFDGFKRELNAIAHPYEEEEPAGAVIEEMEEEAQEPVSLEEERSKREAEQEPEPAAGYVPFPIPEPKQPERVVPLGGNTQPKLAVIRPRQFGDAGAILEQLRQKRTIVLNLEDVDEKTALRLLDVVSGAAFALEGKVKKVARSTFVVAPYHVDFLTITLDDLKDAPTINLNI